MPNRPSKRTLVRWNDDHDKELLLWIVYCCNEVGIKIPFARIAQCMGASFTEGACIQHLAKIRNKMEEAGLHVPPTQKRGTVTRTGSSIYRPKPKDAQAPVPRVRPETAPAPCLSGSYDDDDDDDEEEEVEEHLDFSASPMRTRAKTLLPLGHGHQRRREVSFKLDSDDDDPMSPLYDSDNEYGAKKPKPSPPKKQTTDPHKVQVKLNFGDKSLRLPAGSNQECAGIESGQVESGTVKSDQISPRIKYESLDTSMADYTTQSSPAQLRGSRRRSSALALDDEDDTEYDPCTKGKGRSKKPRGSRAAKKQKVDDKTKTKVGSEKQKKVHAALTRYEEDTELDADRAAMPPPSYSSYNPDFGGGWNSNFMQHPFASAEQNLGFDGVDHNDGAFNDFSPATQYNGLSYSQAPSFHNSSFNAYHQPTFGNYVGGMSASTSAPNTRTHSFASADSSSTVESQPATWNQPYRTPGFPNPKEASLTLHNAVSRLHADARTKINIYQAPPSAARPTNGFGFHPLKMLPFPSDAVEVSTSEQQPEVPEPPQVPEDDVNFSEYLNDEYL